MQYAPERHDQEQKEQDKSGFMFCFFKDEYPGCNPTHQQYCKKPFGIRISIHEHDGKRKPESQREGKPFQYVQDSAQGKLLYVKIVIRPLKANSVPNFGFILPVRMLLTRLYQTALKL